MYPIDEATKLYTEEFLANGLDELLKANKETAFVYLKVNFLKEDHKNLIGMALKDIARIIRNQIRNIDFALKLKDGILLLLPGITTAKAEKIIDRIIKKIESPNFFDGYTVLSLPKKLETVIFACPKDVKTKEEVLKKVGEGKIGA